VMIRWEGSPVHMGGLSRWLTTWSSTWCCAGEIFAIASGKPHGRTRVERGLHGQTRLRQCLTEDTHASWFPSHQLVRWLATWNSTWGCAGKNFAIASGKPHGRTHAEGGIHGQARLRRHSIEDNHASAPFLIPVSRPDLEVGLVGKGKCLSTWTSFRRLFG
jgi:hypothetical protein